MRRGKEIDLLLAIRAKAREAVLASYPTDTVSGDPASFPDGADDVPVKSLKVSIQPVQDGSGDPSPENVRPISGRTGLTLYHSGADTSDPEALPVSFPAEAGTVYGGTLDVTTGVLTVDMGLFALDGTYNPANITSVVSRGTELTGFWIALLGFLPYAGRYTMICDQLPNRLEESFATPGLGFGETGAYPNSIWIHMPVSLVGSTKESILSYVSNYPLHFAVKLGTPTSYQLTPAEVRTLLGENNIWSDAGDVAVEYRADLELYIEKRLDGNSLGALSLGAAPSLIRPGTGLEMQNLGLDDADTDYIDELPDADEYLGDLEDDEDILGGEEPDGEDGETE